jgi:outer membrane protein assembly factor BamA
VLVATLHDKLSWFAAPTFYYLPTEIAIGGGFVENDFGGRDQKVLVYGQYGTQQSFLFATFLDPSVHGSKLTYRVDLYLERRLIDEYANPPNDPTSQAIARETTQTFLDAGLLVGWNFYWWLVGDVRLRGAWVTFRDANNPTTKAAEPLPEKDGRDVTAQFELTLDHRINRFGTTKGLYAQLHLETSIPALDNYGYAWGQIRAYYSWVFFGEHELELRTLEAVGYHLPIQEDLALGGASDLRGYLLDQFRGDVNAFFRAEYSVPIYHWHYISWLNLKFRALGFFDGGYSGFFNPELADRNYLPNQLGQRWLRDDVGGGIRLYVNNVVLPLLGVDVGYGIQARAPEVYFELGLTDF